MIYKIIMKKNDFFKIHNRIAVKNLEIKEEEVNFEVELGSLNVLKETGYPYHLVDSIRIKLNMFFKKYYHVIIGIIFLFSILYINTFRVSSIEFNRVTPINTVIETEIKNSYKRLFCFDFSNLDYTSFSKKLRRQYIEYPYIEVYSRNNKIKVDIFSYDSSTSQLPLDDSFGDVVALKDGVVDSFYIYAGENQVSKNQYVKKGDILIRGKVQETSIFSKGLILAHTYEKYVISVPKRETIEVVSNSNQKYYSISFFTASFSPNKKQSYLLYDKCEKSIFNFFDIFSLKEIEEHEKNAIIKENKYDEAIQIAEEKIKDNFDQNKTNDLEKIEEMKLYNTVEKDNEYILTFILKKIESIGQFVPY